ncbi:apolipoprotein N-acyltransferase, partial [bacterium]|nr:apolipoprotein N-acyltransferase [bacterium]
SLPDLSVGRGAGRDGRAATTAAALSLACLVAWGSLALLSGRGDADTAAGTVRVAAVQADVALRDKWTQGRIDSTTVPYTAMSAAAAREGVELLVWAETAVPAYLMYERHLLSWVRAVADTNDVYLYTGFPDANLDADGRQLRTNASGLFDPGGRLCDRYAKHHLLPFGERMPFQSVMPWLGNVDLGQAEWEPGAPPAPMDVLLADGRALRLGGLICYESIFPSLARHAVRAGAGVLVNITNDGWFGRTAGPVQHAEMARMRAVECGVPLVRCANNGISYITDDGGVVRRRAGLGERALVIDDVSPGRRGTRYLRHGAWPLLIFLSAWSAVAMALTARGRR